MSESSDFEDHHHQQRTVGLSVVTPSDTSTPGTSSDWSTASSSVSFSASISAFEPPSGDSTRDHPPSAPDSPTDFLSPIDPPQPTVGPGPDPGPGPGPTETPYPGQTPRLYTLGLVADTSTPTLEEGARKVYTPLERQQILDEYLRERAKFVKHIKRRTKNFEQKIKEDYDRAKWGREPVKPVQSKAVPLDQSQTQTITKSSLGAAGSATSQQTSNPGQKQKQKQKQNEGIKGARGIGITGGNGNAAEMNRITRGVSSLASGSASAAFAPTVTRNFATSSTALAANDAVKRKKKRAAKAAEKAALLTTEEAIRVLRSVEVLHPTSTFSCELHIGSKGNLPSIRGRVTMPYNVKRTPDVLVVFAEQGSDSASLALAAGADHVGGPELFEQLESETIRPTKVLSTTGMLGQVTSRMGRFLGQRGLMPTARRGGVGDGQDLVQRIAEARGATDWMTNDIGMIKTVVGRNTLTPEQITANLRALTTSVRAAFPDVGPDNNDDQLVSRVKRKKPKPTTWFEKMSLQSTYSPRIFVNDID